MPKQQRYSITTDGVLEDRKTNSSDRIKEFYIHKSKRGDMVEILTNSGKNLRVCRWNINESLFSLGDGPASKPTQPDVAVSVVPKGIEISKAELLAVMESCQNAADLMRRRFVQLLRDQEN
jgi:hypothetical protein